MVATGKRYYWMKLYSDFMTSDEIEYLMSEPNGAKYVVLYQMLCLKTINTSGKLIQKIGEIVVPFDEEKIKKDCKFFSKKIIQNALEIYLKIGLIQVESDGIFSIKNHKNFVGSETDYARQKQTQRRKADIEDNNAEGIDEAKNLDGDMDKSADNVHTEYRVKSIENKILDIRDKSIEVVEEEEKEDYGNGDSKLAFFDKNLLLSENQIADLLDKLGREVFYEYADRLSRYISDTGYRFKNHYETILKWYNEDRKL